MAIFQKTLAGTCEITTGTFTPTTAMPMFTGENNSIVLSVAFKNGGADYDIPLDVTVRAYLYYGARPAMTPPVLMDVVDNVASCALPDTFMPLSGSPQVVVRMVGASSEVVVACAFAINVKAVTTDNMVYLSPPNPDTITYIGRSPYIGENGNWYTFSNTTYAYVDTGVSATIAYASDIPTDTAGVSVQDALDAHTSQLAETSNRQYEAVTLPAWESGSFDASGNKIASSTRIRIAERIILYKGAKISLANYSTNKFAAQLYNVVTGAFISSSGWQTSEYTMPSDYQVNISLAYAGDGAIAPTAGSVVSAKTLITGRLSYAVDYSAARIDAADSLLRVQVMPTWEQGSFDLVGLPVANTRRIRTNDFITLGKGSRVSVSDYATFKFALQLYDVATHAFVTAAGWLSSDYELANDYAAKVSLAYVDSRVMPDNGVGNSSVTVLKALNSPTVVTAKTIGVLSPDYTSVDLTSIMSQWSDFVFVGDELWFFCPTATDDFTTTSTIYRVNPITWEVVGIITHNLGHVNAVHYDAASDVLLATNHRGTDSTGFTAKLFLFYGVSAWGSSVVFATADKTVIDLAAITDAVDIDACFGETNNGKRNIAYFTNENSVTKIYKILLGMGTNDLGGGTYSAAAADRYNGTYKILKSATNIPIDTYNEEVVQGIDYHNGKIYTSNGHTGIKGNIWEFMTDGTVLRQMILNFKYADDGSVISGFNEGIAIKAGKIYHGSMTSTQRCIVQYDVP